ncbi:MAG: hypothetical protein ACUVWK_04380 [Nitrososphaerales archaeon]
MKELIPTGAENMIGGATALEQIGFVDLLKSGKYLWKNLKDEVIALNLKSALILTFVRRIYRYAQVGS